MSNAEFAKAKHLATGEPRDADPACQANDDHDVFDARWEYGNDRQDEEEDREAHEDLDNPGDHDVGPAAVEAGGGAETEADQGSDAHRDEADPHRDLGAVDQARHHIAAKIVGSEPVFPGGGLELVPGNLRGAIAYRWHQSPVATGLEMFLELEAHPAEGRGSLEQDGAEQGDLLKGLFRGGEVPSRACCAARGYIFHFAADLRLSSIKLPLNIPISVVIYKLSWNISKSRISVIASLVKLV